MKIDIRSSNLPRSESLHAHIERKLAFALGRFADRIRVVHVRVRDLNGPRGGIDKLCRMVLFVAPRSSLVVEATDADAYAAVSQAALKLQERFVRNLTRKRGARAIPTMPDMEAP
jgi:putative sigma-54 modulation protein